jgi:hypothetical protein
MGSTEEPKPVTTTVHAYDSQQLRSLFKSQLMGVGMMGVMHLYFQYTNPLLIQSIIPLKGAFEGNLVKVHLFGQPAVGELKRPWKASGGLMGMQGSRPIKRALKPQKRPGVAELKTSRMSKTSRVVWMSAKRIRATSTSARTAYKHGRACTLCRKVDA